MASSTPPPELLAELAAALDHAGVPYMVVGSFASALHGRPRATQDVDVVIDPPAGSLPALLAAFPDDRFYVSAEAAADALRRRTMFNAIDHRSGWKIDLMVRKDRPFSRAEFDRRIAAPWRGGTLHVASAEDVVVAKLEWAQSSGSARQIEDVAAVLKLQGDALDRDYIRKWVAALGLETPWHAALESDS